MSKYLKIAVAALMAVAMAAPAFADSKISGYFRNQFIMDNLGSAASPFALQDGTSENKKGHGQIDQRLRVKYQNNLNEYVNFVYYGEVDTKWGQASKGSIGGGGQAGADGVNVETKNVFLDFTIPASIWAVRTGVQGYGIGPDGIVEGNDVAGIQVSHVFAPNFNVVTAFFKPYENNRLEWDDQDLYSVKANFKASDMANIFGDLTYLDLNGLDNGGISVPAALAGAQGVGFEDADVYVIDAGANLDLGMAKLDLFAAYSGGTVNAAAGEDLDISGWMATAKVTGDLGAAKAGLRLTYYSSDDDGLSDDESNVFVGDLTGGAYEFYNENLSIFYTDKYYNNTNGGRAALTDAAYNGNGLLAVNATADFKLPADMYLNSGAGYFMALEENGRDDKDLGIEVAARIGTKVAEKVDVSLGGAYAFLGDFYGNDPDDYYKVNFMLNVGF